MADSSTNKMNLKEINTWIVNALLGICVFFLVQTHTTVLDTQKAVNALVASNAARDVRMDNLEARVFRAEKWIEDRKSRMQEYFENNQMKRQR